MSVTIRPARLGERAALQELIAESARGLSRADYSDAQIEGAIAEIFGVDTDLIHDGTYMAAEQAGQVVGCGGWSRRKTLFGGDQYAAREPQFLTPGQDAAKIRAFFVRPAWARQGIGRAILQRCEDEARAAGFSSFELMATRPGQRLYAAMGYQAGPPVEYPLRAAGISITFVPMTKPAIP
jgi:GNAT superfamily N-acetyltransferase